MAFQFPPEKIATNFILKASNKKLRIKRKTLYIYEYRVFIYKYLVKILLLKSNFRKLDI